MTPAVQMKHCEQSAERDNATRASAPREDTTVSRLTPEPPESSSEAGNHQPEISGLLTKEVGRADADSPVGKMTERSPPYEGTAPAALPEPIQELRDRETWVELCSATDYESGQLLGDVGTAKDPLFTYEEAVRHRHCKLGLTLYVGEDIIPVEGDRLSEMSEPNVKKLWKQAAEGLASRG